MELVRNRVRAAAARVVAVHAQQLEQRGLDLHGQAVVDVRQVAAHDPREVVDREHRVVHPRPRLQAGRVRRRHARVRVVAAAGADRDGPAREGGPPQAPHAPGVGQTDDGVDEGRTIGRRAGRLVLNESQAHQRRQMGRDGVAAQQHGGDRRSAGAGVVVERHRAVRPHDAGGRCRTQLPGDRVRRRRSRRGRAGRRDGDRRRLGRDGFGATGDAPQHARGAGGRQAGGVSEPTVRSQCGHGVPPHATVEGRPFLNRQLSVKDRRRVSQWPR